MRKRVAAIDRFALRRDKRMTPGARIDWLAAALTFAAPSKKTKSQYHARP